MSWFDSSLTVFNMTVKETSNDSPLTGFLLSSVHGRERRLEREIGKHDLIAALKYGIRQESHSGRFKFTFANVVYITDSSCTREITSYVQAFNSRITPMIDISAADIRNHQILKEKLLNNKLLLSSHSVLVVDQSASMKNRDVTDYKNRSEAVYSSIALDYIAARLDQGLIEGTDIVTLIEMKDESNIVFDREPITNVLYNMVLQRQQDSSPSNHGNYLNALSLVEIVIEPELENPNCAVSVLFLSGIYY